MKKSPKTKEEILVYSADKKQIDAVKIDLYDWRDENLTLEKNGIQVIEDDIDPNVIKTLVENTDFTHLGARTTSVPKNKSDAINFFKEVERTVVEKLNYFAACCRIYHYRDDNTELVQTVQLAHLDMDNLDVSMFVKGFIDKNFARKNIDISEAYSRECHYLGFWKNLTPTPNSQAFCISDLDTLTLDNYCQWGNVMNLSNHEEGDPTLTPEARYFVQQKLGDGFHQFADEDDCIQLLEKKKYSQFITVNRDHFTIYNHTDNVKWYIFDDLQENETLVFNHFNFKRKTEGLAFANIHASTGYRGDKFIPRNSIDTRVMCFKG